MSPDRTTSLSHFAFMPLPNFTMIAFTNAIEVLRMANYLSGQPLYRWSVISPDGGPVTASNGLTVDTGPAECVGQPDIVFVCGGVDVQRATTPAHLSTLRRFARSGIRSAACARAPMRSRNRGCSPATRARSTGRTCRR